ncbi:MAG: methyltransferase [Anaerolineales bacterium]|jgi:protein-S-isoprenylcysteine O-methyltransferase Ste14
MFVLYLGLVGFLAFIIAVGIFGTWLRKNPTIENAEKSGRIMHYLFFAGLVAPAVIVLITPGLSQLDGMIGIPSLPSNNVLLISGVLLAFPGLYLLGTSNKLLRSKGYGANASQLTDRIVQTNIYERIRNPMSLGYYLWALSLGLISESTFVTIFVLLGFVPAHIFFLKYFEEFELELRFGESYKQYKQKVPFLIPKL